MVEVDGIEKEEKFEDVLFIILGVLEEEKMLEGIPVDGVLDLFIISNVSIKPGLQLETDLIGVGLKIFAFLLSTLCKVCFKNVNILWCLTITFWNSSSERPLALHFSCQNLMKVYAFCV